MSSAEVAILMSRLKRPPRVRPAERLGEDGVEVVDEGEYALTKVIERGEAGPLEKAASQDREPDLDLVEPGAVARGIHEADAMGGVFEESPASLLRLEDALLSLDPEGFFDAATVCHQLDEGRRDVGVELVCHEDPGCLRVGIDRAIDAGNKVVLRSCESERRAHDLARDDIEVRNQAQRAVSDVLELHALHEAG